LRRSCYVPADPIDEACLRDGAIKRLLRPWLFRQVAQRVETTFTEADIL
jgi:hypothetical protein